MRTWEVNKYLGNETWILHWRWRCSNMTSSSTDKSTEIVFFANRIHRHIAQRTPYDYCAQVIRTCTTNPHAETADRRMRMCTHADVHASCRAMWLHTLRTVYTRGFFIQRRSFFGVKNSTALSKATGKRNYWTYKAFTDWALWSHLVDTNDKFDSTAHENQNLSC